MKRFTRKISAVLIATLLIMTAAPNLAYANDDTDFAPQSEVVAESVQTTDPAPAADPEPASDDPAPALDPAPAEENTPVENATPEVEEVQSPESAPVGENTPEADSTPEAGGEITSNETIGGDVILKGEITAAGTNYKADKALITPENLTVLLRGLTEENKVETMLLIDQYIQVVVDQNKALNITGDSFVDAEKFSTGTPGFDSQHCWAATASNILWTTGYAQKVINPMTIDPRTGKGGRPFASEDEVLAYFSDNFTDAPGDPKEGVNWFMKGTGAYSSELQNMTGVAHYIDADSGNLLPNAIQTSYLWELWDFREDNPSGKPDAISSVLSVCSQGMGVLVRWFQDNKISSAAHWMTVVGAIVDEAANTLAGKYQALIVADSDRNPAHPESVDLKATTTAQKLAEKAACVNSYTVYKLEFQQGLNGKGAWRLVGFAENANKMAIISHLYMLHDNDKGPQGSPTGEIDYKHLLNSENVSYSSNEGFTVNVTEQAPQSGSCQTPVVEETKDAIVITDGLNAIVIAKEDILSALSEAELETSENLENLLEFMTDNNVEIFPQAKGVVSVNSGNNYVAYIKTPVTAKITVSVDGIALPEDAYEIVILPNGMTKLRIKNSYLKALSIGAHSLQINVEGTDSVISSLINVID